MKSIYEFILSEHLLKHKTEKHKTEITYRPTEYADLKQIIEKLINDGETNFNCIDTSKITNMEYLFPYDMNYNNAEDVVVSGFAANLL